MSDHELEPIRPFNRANLTAAVEATTANVARRPSRAPKVLAWMRASALIASIAIAIVAPTALPIPVGYWGFFAILAGAMVAAHEVTARRSDKERSPWAGGVAITALVGGIALMAMGRLSIPWAVGAVAIGALLGWWGAHMRNVGESLTWTPGSDDLRYRDASGTLDHADWVALIVEPIAADEAAVATAADTVARLGDLRSVLNWLTTETGADGSVAIEALSEHQRLVVAIALRVHASASNPTLQPPPAPLPPAPPA